MYKHNLTNNEKLMDNEIKGFNDHFYSVHQLS